MELYIYDPVELAGILDDATSVRWRRMYFTPGEFEIHLAATEANLRLLADGRIIRRVDRKEAGIIEAHEVKDDDLQVSGRFLSSVLERAVISRTYTFSKTYEQAMLMLIPEGTRVCPSLTAAPAKGLPGAISAQVTWKNLLATLEKFARASGVGFRVLFEPGVWTFEAYAGADRSVSQTENARVYFSDEFENLIDPAYSDDSSKWKNFAFVGGDGEGSARTVVTVDHTGGGERREIFVDARDLSRDGLTDAEYLAALRQRGEERLAACIRVLAFEGGGEAVGNFEYLTDWDLGDIVTVQFAKLGISENLRITEVEEVYEGGVLTVTPTFGTPLPETLDIGDD